MKLLLVEDNPGQAAVAQGFLSLGLPESEVHLVETLADAKTALAQGRFDLVLLDLGLPDGDGLEVLFSVDDTGLDVPVVVLTAQGEEGLGPLCIQAGASDFISKRELTMESLVRAVEFGVSRKSESIVRDLSRVVAELRSLSQSKNQDFSKRLETHYTRLITEARFLLSDEHKSLVTLMGEAKMTGTDVIGLHANCLETACREAEDGAESRYLMNCQTVLASTLAYLADYYRELS